MTITRTIKACPFCGDTAVSFETQDTFWHVSCEGAEDEECRGIDDGSGQGYTQEQYAIEAWNKRAGDLAELTPTSTTGTASRGTD